MSLNSKKFSENLIRLRKYKGLSIKDLSQKTGISQRMIVHYEKHVSYPSLDKIEIIANALKVNITDLLGISEKSGNYDMTDFDVRTIKKLKKLLILNPQDRLSVYKMIDLLVQKDEYKNSLKTLEKEQELLIS